MKFLTKNPTQFTHQARSLLGILSLVFTMQSLFATEAFAQAKKKSTKTTTEAKTTDAKATDAKPADTAAAPAAPSAEAPKAGNQNDLTKVDEEITNARMRAELGATKKWSFNATLAYNGSTLARPAEDLRPNIVGGTTNSDLSTSLGGFVGVNYRVDKNNSYSLTTGVNILTPFSGDWTRSRIQNPTYSGAGDRRRVQRVNVADPSLVYTRSGRIGDIQSISSYSANFVTDPIYQNNTGILGSFSFSQTLAVQNGNWTLGGYLGATFWVYEASLNAQQKAGEALFSGSFTPFVEYQFNDLIGWRAVFNYFGWDYLKNASNLGQSAYSFYTPQNSTGVMFSLSRDFWLYPNIQFLPFNLRSDLTNWGVQAIINL